VGIEVTKTIYAAKGLKQTVEETLFANRKSKEKNAPSPSN
jgi:hypothetical protein